jgi:hypothetical protein
MKYENLTDVTKALASSNCELITINIIVTCIAIVTVYVHSRLKKSAELKEINNNFSNVLQQQAELTLATGQIKNSLSKDQINYQIKLNAYHEKSIESIKEIFVKLLDLRDASKALSLTQNDEVVQKFVNAVSMFRRTLDEKKIWISNELSCDIEAIAIEIDKRTNPFILASKKEPNIQNMSEGQIEKLIKDQEAFYDYLQQKSRNIFNGLAEKLSKAVLA